MADDVDNKNQGSTESFNKCDSKKDDKDTIRLMTSSFSMAYALSIAQRRIEERRKIKEEEEKALDEEKKERARAKRKRRRQNQKLAKAKVRELAATTGGDSEDTNEADQIDGDTEDCDSKPSLKRNNSDQDLIVRTPAKKRLRFDSPERPKPGGEVKTLPESNISDEPTSTNKRKNEENSYCSNNSVKTTASKKMLFIPRALLLKK